MLHPQLNDIRPKAAFTKQYKTNPPLVKIMFNRKAAGQDRNKTDSGRGALGGAVGVLLAAPYSAMEDNVGAIHESPFAVTVPDRIV